MSESVCAIFFSFLSVGISFCVCYVNRRSVIVFDFFRSSFFASFFVAVLLSRNVNDLSRRRNLR